MNETANQPPQPRWWLRLLVLAVVLAAFFLAVTAVQVVRTASLQELHPADAIVIFGAAEYSGRPSPVLRARLDHALDFSTAASRRSSLRREAPLLTPSSAKAEWAATI